MCLFAYIHIYKCVHPEMVTENGAGFSSYGPLACNSDVLTGINMDSTFNTKMPYTAVVIIYFLGILTRIFGIRIGLSHQACCLWGKCVQAELSKVSRFKDGQHPPTQDWSCGCSCPLVCLMNNNNANLLICFGANPRWSLRPQISSVITCDGKYQFSMWESNSGIKRFTSEDHSFFHGLQTYS